MCKTEGDGGDMCVCARMCLHVTKHVSCGKYACALLTKLVQSCVLCKGDFMKC